MKGVVTAVEGTGVRVQLEGKNDDIVFDHDAVCPLSECVYCSGEIAQWCTYLFTPHLMVYMFTPHLMVYLFPPHLMVYLCNAKLYQTDRPICRMLSTG